MAILLVGTLDTKGAEYAFARSVAESEGLEVILMDTGVMGQAQCGADITASQVARAGGHSLGALRALGDRNAALEVMTGGALAQLRSLESMVDGVLALGGSGGTAVGTAVMRSLPVGVPKVMVSTLTSGDISAYVGESDIAMMHSVVDIAGLNRISRRVIANAVYALCGMVRGGDFGRESPTDRPLIAATMFGVTTPCVTRLRCMLEKAGYEVVVFHATGSGGRAMENLIRDGYFDAVADVTTTEWADEVVGGILSAGPDRLTAAAEKGVPQVVTCGALDMVNFRGMDQVPDQFRNRRLHAHNAHVTLMRTSTEECYRIGQAIGHRLSKAAGPVTLLIPLGGVSAIDAPGRPFHDPEANRVLFASLKEHCRPAVRIVECDAHINDDAFVDMLGSTLLDMLNPQHA